MVFLKLVVGGIVATVIAWTLLVIVHYYRMIAFAKRQDTSALVAVAGGWTYLAQLPGVIVLLTAAFGVGLFVTSRLLRH